MPARAVVAAALALLFLVICFKDAAFRRSAPNIAAGLLLGLCAVGGWLVTNIWHTTQYLMIVWLFNQNASAKLQAQSGWFIRASRGNRALLYFGVCFLLAFPAYYVLSNVIQAGEIGLLSAIVLNQSINFHHFITDAVIWRARRKPAGAPA